MVCSYTSFRNGIMLGLLLFAVNARRFWYRVFLFPVSFVAARFSSRLLVSYPGLVFNTCIICGVGQFLFLAASCATSSE